MLAKDYGSFNWLVIILNVVSALNQSQHQSYNFQETDRIA